MLYSGHQLLAYAPNKEYKELLCYEPKGRYISFFFSFTIFFLKKRTLSLYALLVCAVCTYIFIECCFVISIRLVFFFCFHRNICARRSIVYAVLSRLFPFLSYSITELCVRRRYLLDSRLYCSVANVFFLLYRIEALHSPFSQKQQHKKKNKKTPNKFNIYIILDSLYGLMHLLLIFLGFVFYFYSANTFLHCDCQVCVFCSLFCSKAAFIVSE